MKDGDAAWLLRGVRYVQGRAQLVAVERAQAHMDDLARFGNGGARHLPRIS
jgi:hypothetical protein